jgi:protein TonB
MSATLERPREAPPQPPRPPVEPPRFRLIETSAQPRRGWATFAMSIVTHVALVAAIVILPLLSEEPLIPNNAVRSFFVAPEAMTPPPPPPPPPAPIRAEVRRPAATPAPPPVRENVFRAPVEIPDVVTPDEAAPDLGVDGGVEGGVEGGMAGGVVGGIVGGVGEATAAPQKIIRIGGSVKAPQLIHRVEPVYPIIARQARISGTVVLRAIVDHRGHVREVSVVRDIPLLSAAALEAVRQWRYRPLLLNGGPYEFELNVNITFSITQ